MQPYARTPQRGLVLVAFFSLAALAPGALAAGGPPPAAGPVGTAGGIRVSSPEMVLLGSAERCLRPAEVDYRKAQAATPEFQEIRREGIEEGSARYELLVRRMSARITAALRAVAAEAGYDCIVVKGSVRDAGGLDVADATEALLGRLRT